MNCAACEDYYILFHITEEYYHLCPCLDKKRLDAIDKINELNSVIYKKKVLNSHND